MSSTDRPELSIVVPVYNESAGLPHFHTAISQVLNKTGLTYELVYVDDGSTDGSDDVIAGLDDRHVQPVYLSRNFGKEAATTAGLRACRGRAAIILDADGQHPVELIPEFIAKWRAGSEVVIGIRTANSKEGFTKRQGSKMFYRSLKVMGVPDIQPGSTDFRLVTRQVIDAFNGLTEHNRVDRALIDWLGFKRDYIPFVAKAREHGQATYSFRKLVQLALNGFVSLSFTPLYLSGYIGVFITLLSFVSGTFAIIEKYLLGDPLGWNITGTAILALMLLFLVGILMIGQGLMAIYIARIYTDSQNRPLYVVRNRR